MSRQVICARGERERAGDVERGATVVTGERRRDHFVASRQLAQHRPPVVPGAGEAVEEKQRLAGAGAV
jgi:hypothetical protein